ncbi:MAG: cupredoxin domain-containing protein [Acetobacteraceae bacterium]|nr:cupredoxin domain-containing protein [Acetobacteraceae bacterium]
MTAWIAGWALLLACAVAAVPARAADPVGLILKDHRFTPDHLEVPSGERFRIAVSNQDATPAEFESYDLKVEKIVVPGGTVTVSAGPLHPGTYTFFDDYHPDAARGTITAVAAKG